MLRSILTRVGLALASVLALSTLTTLSARADLGAAEPQLGTILPGTVERLAAEPAPTTRPLEDTQAMQEDRERFGAATLGLGVADNDATHYARGSTLIMHVFIDHLAGSWSDTERAEAGGKAFLSKQYYLDKAPSAANLSFDNEGGTVFWYVNAYVDSVLTPVEWDDVNAALASIGVTDIDGDGTVVDEYSLGLQNWNGGWDNVILVFQAADVSGRAWASYGTSATACYVGDVWQTWAHEWGHSFGSCDEYEEDFECNNGINCDECQGWYLSDPFDNGNCELATCGTPVNCLMLNGAESICSYTNDHWSWNDADFNGQLDWVKRISDFGSELDIMEMWNNGWFYHYTQADAFAAHVTVPGWTVFGLRSPSTADYDLRLFGDNNQTYQYATSAWAGTDVDFIVGDYHRNRLGVEHIRANRYSGAADNYNVVWEGNGDVLYPDGVPRAQNWIPENVVQIFDVPLFADETVTFELDVTSGSVDMGMALFTSYGTTFFAGRSAALWSRDNLGPGGTEIYTYPVQDDDVYGLVVWSNAPAAGSFTIKVGPSPITLQEEMPAYSSFGLRLYNYDPAVPYWAVVGSRPDDGNAISLRLFADAQHTIPLATSDEPGDELELVAVNYADAPINRDHLRLASPGGGAYRTEWEQSADLSTGYIQDTWSSTHVAKVWDVYLEADQTYFFRQYHPMFIPLLDAGLYLFDPTRDASQSKAQAADFSDAFTASEGERFSFTPDYTGFHGLAMVLNHEASDGYTIWWGPQLNLSDDQTRITSNEIVYGTSTVVSNDWVVWGARPAQGDEVTAWCFGTDNSYGSYEAFSGFSEGVNLVVSDRNHLPVAEPVYTRFSRTVGTGPVHYEFESGVGENLPYTEDGIEIVDLVWEENDVVEGFDLSLDGSRGNPAYVRIQATVTSGDLDLGLALFRSSSGLDNYYQGLVDAQVVANDNGDGESETLEYAAEAIDIYGVVIWNENGGSGTYQLAIVGSPILDAADTGAGPSAVALRSGPNPLRGPAQLSIDLPAQESVRMVVYDVGGRELRTLVDDTLPAGVHQVVWDGRDAGGEMTGPGVYLVRMVAGTETHTTKLVRPGS
jgi:hypothetical protein